MERLKDTRKDRKNGRGVGHTEEKNDKRIKVGYIDRKDQTLRRMEGQEEGRRQGREAICKKKRNVGVKRDWTQ